MDFSSLLLIFTSGIVVNNYVLQRFLGICPFLGVSKRIDQAAGMGFAVTAVMLLATAVTYPIRIFILDPMDLQYLQTVSFILVIASLVALAEILIKRFSPPLHSALGIYLPLITTNCAVLGVTINNLSDGYSFVESLISSLGVGVGFLLAMLIFSGVRERIKDAPTPKAMRGLPITLVAAALLSLAFYGFGGIFERILG